MPLARSFRLLTESCRTGAIRWHVVSLSRAANYRISAMHMPEIWCSEMSNVASRARPLQETWGRQRCFAMLKSRSNFLHAPQLFMRRGHSSGCICLQVQDEGRSPAR